MERNPGLSVRGNVPVNTHAKWCPVERARTRHVAQLIRWREGPGLRTRFIYGPVSLLPPTTVIPGLDRLPSDIWIAFDARKYCTRDVGITIARVNVIASAASLRTTRHRCTTVPGLDQLYPDTPNAVRAQPLSILGTGTHDCPPWPMQ